MKEYGVKEINNMIKDAFSAIFPDNIIAIGEVVDMSPNKSGHYYFNIKEGDAVISVTYFKYYINSSSFIPKNGDKVRITGSIRTYDKLSKYQINAVKVEYNSEGDLWKQFEEIKKKLMLEGLFDASRKRPIPQYPYRAAVLTSFTGSVIGDFLTTTKNEQGRYLIDVWSIPVQNVENAKIIADTIRKVGKYKDRYDVMVVMRGGGSMEDLSVFNQEIIARAVADCEIPVISAIGHDPDYTIIDFVADHRAATPTAAATLLSSGYKAAIKLIDVLHDKMERKVKEKLHRSAQDIDYITAKLEKNSPSFLLSKMELRLHHNKQRMENIINKKMYNINSLIMKLEANIAKSSPESKLESFNLRVSSGEKHLYKSCFSYIEKQKLKIDYLKDKINKHNPDKNRESYLYKLENYEKYLERIIRDKELSGYEKINKNSKAIIDKISDYLFEKTSNITILENKLQLLDPYNIMDRGYALVSQDNKIVSSVDDVSFQTGLNIMLKDGNIIAAAEKIEKNKDNKNSNLKDDSKENILK